MTTIESSVWTTAEAQCRFRNRAEVDAILALAGAMVAVAVAASIVVIRPWPLAVALVVVTLVFAVRAVPRRIPQVTLSDEGVEVRDFMRRYEVPWRDVRDFRLARRAPTRPVRIVVALEDGSTREPDALAQTLIKGPRQERRLRAMVDEMNRRAAELRGIR